MKRLHKILMGGAVALALAVAFAGCKNANDTVGEADLINYTSSTNSTTKAEATASINYTNSTGDYKRGMRLFNNKKKGITTKFVLDVSNSNNPGLLGIVFDLTDNKDGTMNFCVVGVKSKPSNGKAETYVTYFKNVSESNFDKQNFGVSGSNLVYLEPADNSNTELNISPKDGKLNIGVKIEALKKTLDFCLKREYPLCCNKNARMAELVDALVSGASVERRAGSSPVLGTQAQVVKLVYTLL